MTQQKAPPTTMAPGPTTRARLFFVDNLRVVLTVLVVLHHAALTYSNIPLWFYIEPAQDPSGHALDLFIILNQTFFMGMFFLLAGYFVPGAADRRGRRGFTRERLVRLGVPLLLFVILLRPLASAPSYTTLLATEPDLPYWLFYLFTIAPGPLWFAEVLLVMSLVYVLIRRFRERRSTTVVDVTGFDAGAGVAARAERPANTAPLNWFGMGWFVPFMLFAVGLALVTIAWRYAFPASYWPIVGLPSPGYLPQYAALFALGVFAYRRNWLIRLPNSAGWGGLAVALVSLIGLGASVIVLGEAAMVPRTWQSMVGVPVETFFAMGVMLALVVFFRRFLNRSNRFLKFLADNAFAVYVLHSVVLVWVGVALSGWEAGALVKFFGLAALSVPLCWAVAGAVRAIPGVKRIL
ncbi:acyltransferase family protein [Nocardiopsis valliformis]|uniref:acyltransferase family protein n=1 Tax=Nocardiopsis valliformis TaxID=239974 RepID=UPI000475B65E|nr:acyltransferase [Nocardiopsis valliformis]